VANGLEREIFPPALSPWKKCLKMQAFRSSGVAIVLALAAVAAAERANARPGFEITVADGAQPVADDSTFASRQSAEEFLTHALPIATAANPRYRTDKPGVTMAWITKSIKFGPGKTPNGRLASMSEEVLEFHNGVRSATGSHDAEFLIADVKISERNDSADLTENGDPAVGIIFSCNEGKCIRSNYDGAPSFAEWTDISIQDSALRAKILGAFLTIKQAEGPNDARR